MKTCFSEETQNNLDPPPPFSTNPPISEQFFEYF